MKKVLVLGASGYIGSQLLPILVNQGYQVTAAGRELEQLKAKTASHPNLSYRHLDLENLETTIDAVQGYELVYFLVHGMNYGTNFLEYEMTLVRNCIEGLKQSKEIKHVVYLSAIQPEYGISDHLKARKQTGELLRTLAIPITELRAGVIIGPGSAAFEIMRDFTYNFPVMIAPKWIDSKANPIALQNLNFYLLQLAKDTPESHQIYEVGGPDVLTYREQFKIISQIAHKPFKLYSTRMLSPKLASYWLSLVTSVPSNIGKALLDGLAHDYVAQNDEICQRYPQKLLSYYDAVQYTIAEEGSFIRSQVWGFDPNAIERWQPGFGYYPKKTGASTSTHLTTEQIWQVVCQFGSTEQGYFFANPLWRLREWLDIFVGGKRPVKRMPVGQEVVEGDYIDSWKVIRCQPKRFLSLLFGLKAPGLGRLEFSIKDHGHTRELEIMAWWHPQGFRGLLYWFAMMPAHLFIFRGMVRAIVKKASKLKQQ